MFSNIFGSKSKKLEVNDPDKFFAECISEMEDKNTELSEKYGIGNFSRWDFDQETGELVFSEDGEIKVVSKTSFIGSYSLNSESWMWGWGNDSIMPHLTKKLKEVRDFGEKHGIGDLTDRAWSANEDAGWAMSAAALKILNGLGVYRGNSPDSEYYFLIHNVSKAENS